MDAIDLKLITLLQKECQNAAQGFGKSGFSFLPGNRGADRKA